MNKLITNLIKNDGYVITEIINGYNNVIYRLLKDRKVFYLKRTKNKVAYNNETYVLSNLPNIAKYSKPTIVKKEAKLQVNILTEVKGNNNRFIDIKSASQLGSIIKELHNDLSTISNISYINNSEGFIELFNLFKNNILKEANSKLFFSEEQISILLDTIKLLEEFIIKYYYYLSKSPIHGDLNRGNILWNRNEIGIIDFEKTRIGYFLEDIVRLNARVFNYNSTVFNYFIQSYTNNKESLESIRELFNYFELFDKLGDISYFLYKGYSNGYSFHIPAFYRINNILKKLK